MVRDIFFWWSEISLVTLCSLDAHLTVNTGSQLWRIVWRTLKIYLSYSITAEVPLVGSNGAGDRTRHTRMVEFIRNMRLTDTFMNPLLQWVLYIFAVAVLKRNFLEEGESSWDQLWRANLPWNAATKKCFPKMAVILVGGVVGSFSRFPGGGAGIPLVIWWPSSELYRWMTSLTFRQLTELIGEPSVNLRETCPCCLPTISLRFHSTIYITKVL